MGSNDNQTISEPEAFGTPTPSRTEMSTMAEWDKVLPRGPPSGELRSEGRCNSAPTLPPPQGGMSRPLYASRRSQSEAWSSGSPTVSLPGTARRSLLKAPPISGLRALSSVGVDSEPKRSVGGTLLETHAADEGMFQTLCTLACNRVYRLATFVLCVLFFVVTGVQYWSSKYFIVAFEQPRILVNSVFVCVAGTAPILGIAGGGQIIDRLGGYDSEEGARRAVKLSLLWSVLTALTGIGAGLIAPGPETWRLWVVASLIWVLLLFGAAMLPPLTGLLLQSVDDHLEVFANAMSMLIYSIVGYGFGSYVPGQITSLAPGGDERTALHHAMQVVFFSSGLAAIGMLDLCHAFISHTPTEPEEVDDSDSTEALCPNTPTLPTGRGARDGWRFIQAVHV
eukprot:NODE_669_length_1416_cov_264.614254.p1 GENE.NODE_669_length_1416_cov_264.614254~~NODE_669_length_1416_cov_264.614254.p1  ORF type:complete len:403 (+),score=91.28 NODE_669_length_1416_cov_264.614254:27-1211(+)